MKRISIFLFGCLLLITPALRAQDAAAAAKAELDVTEERYKRLDSALEILLAAKVEQDKRIASLADEIESLRKQQSRPNTSYASQDELRKLAETVQKIDQKRVEDNEHILKEIGKLGKTLAPPSTPPRKSAASGATGVTDTPPALDKGHYKYAVQPGDFVSTIVKAYNEKGIKVTVEQILKANPKLDPNRMRIGQEIIIPAPEK